jgi:hypothetical protein
MILAFINNKTVGSEARIHEKAGEEITPTFMTSHSDKKFAL